MTRRNDDTMRPFMSFYGSKWRLAPRYPAPEYPTIIEPFAGGAGYSMRYPERDVILVERDPVIASVWQYLITADPDEIRMLPPIEHGGSVDDFPELPDGARALMGFWVNHASAHPCKVMSQWALLDVERSERNGTEITGSWGPHIRERIARQVPRIRHWQIINDDYSAAPDVTATWFIDPPYVDRGRYYRYGTRLIDYPALGRWCETRRGQVMACENAGADWLPFGPFIRQQGTTQFGVARISQETIWTNREAALMAVMVNGSTLEWNGYQYALMGQDGEIIEINDLDKLHRHMHINERIMFRASYVTEWAETL